MDSIISVRALSGRAGEMLNGGKDAHRVRRPLHWPIEFPEVMSKERDGFDAFVGNPPFMGGQRLTGHLGTDYRDYLVESVAAGRRGSSDLCAYFFLRAAVLLRVRGGFGLLATNTIAQGDTREVGLDALIAADFTILRAIPSRPWPGDAALEVAHVWLRRGAWAGEAMLNDVRVRTIGPQLTVPGRAATGNPNRLAANAGKSFQGSIVLGLGFTMTPDDAAELMRRDTRNKDVLFPYLNGQDLNSDPEQQASRWVINFSDWPLDRGSARADYRGPIAADYPDCLAIVRRLVKPERDLNSRTQRRERWWQYGERAPALYAAIAKMERVLVTTQTSRTQQPALVPAEQVLGHKLVVFASDASCLFALLSSNIHRNWVLEHGSTMRTDAVYTPSDCFDTFAFPRDLRSLDLVGGRYDSHRHEVMLANQEGITKTYNRFHAPDETSSGIRRLRELHVEMDEAVKLAYGWTDLRLDHGFHETKQGLRYTISEAVRVEVLDRLLALNHERHAEEVKQGLHDEKKPAKAKPAAKPKAAAKPAARPRRVAAAQLDLTARVQLGIENVAEGAWARVRENPKGEAMVAIAAVLKALPGPTSAKVAKVAAMICLEPRILTRMLDAKAAEDWVRVVGDEARAAPAGVRALPPPATPAWSEAERQLRIPNLLLEDQSARTWAPGEGLDSIDTDGWPDARARYVLAAIERLGFETAASQLTDEERSVVAA